MDRGIYINKDKGIVFSGNRKPVDPDGQTWVDVPDAQWPEKLKSDGLFTHLWDGSNIIINPEYLTNKALEDTRLDGIESEKESSGLKSVSIDQAKAFIASKIDTAKDLEELKAGLKIILNKFAAFII